MDRATTANTHTDDVDRILAFGFRWILEDSST